MEEVNFASLGSALKIQTRVKQLTTNIKTAKRISRAESEPERLGHLCVSDRWEGIDAIICLPEFG